MPVYIRGRLTGRSSWNVSIVDLSLSGCLVQCPAALDQDAIVDVELDTGTAKIVVKARVVYASLDGSALPVATRHLVGLQFLGLRAQEEADLRRFLGDELRRHQL